MINLLLQSQPSPPARRLVLRMGLLVLMVLAGTVTVQAQAIDSTQVARYQLAEAYLRAAQFDRAISLLEDLYAANPQTHAFYEKLREAYEQVKRYDDALALIDARLALQPAQPALLAEKGRLRYLKDDEAGADEAWQEALQVAPGNANAYLVVYRALMQLRLFEKAIYVLEQGRMALDNTDVFQTDLAYLYGLNGQYEEAMDEYLNLLLRNDKQLGFVQSRLSRYIEQEEALRASIFVAERGVRRDPLNRTIRELLSWLYLEAGQYREALDANRAIDRLEQEQGRVLFTFAQQASDAGAYDVALSAYEEIRQRYPDAGTAPEALRGIGEMEERWAEKSAERAFDDQANRVSAPHYEKALDVYQAFLQQYPNHPFFPYVLQHIGHLQQDVFFNLGEAEGSLREVVQRFPNSDAAAQAEYDLGSIAMMRNDLETARLTFSRLEERLRTGDFAELARYELAMMHFYQGEFDAAQTLVEAMKENTSADVANDAIELKVLLLENKGPDSLNLPLRRFAEAHLLHRQRRTDAALEVLDGLLETYGTHPLADDARFYRARWLKERGRTTEALASLLEFPLIHPQSFLADKALFEAGEIQASLLDDKEGAIKTFTRLLTEYPGSLLVSDARARIRTLRGDGV